MKLALRRLVVGGLLALWAGCGGAPQSDLPTYHPSAAASKALAEFDRNNDGLLDAAELDQSPGLKSAVPRIDKNGDQKLSAGEISERVAYYRDTRTGFMGVPLTITLSGQPLRGAEVMLTPESCLVDEIQAATGTTGVVGVVAPKIPASEFSGVSPGVYRLSISLKDPAGKETLPGKYNTATTLGLEVAPDVPGLERGVRFDLTK
ncbi:MAG: hypothetical protein SFU86_09610 [Pirellulaceae bacterium]|nr:hypothetical protein [Pirellulaceae bacterium]